MSKLLLFLIFTVILGNPFIAFLLLIIILYFLDRRFIGLTPNIFKPLKTARRISKLKQELKLSPFNSSLKTELARLYIERRKYGDALPYLEEVIQVNADSDEIKAEIGLCYLKTGQIEKGKSLILQALKGNSRVKYGQPYLYLADAFKGINPEEAAGYLEEFKEIQSSSCEAYYRLGILYESLGRANEASDAFREAVDVYAALPKYKRKTERRWALLARLKAK